MNIIYEPRFPHPIGILFETENMFTLDNVDFTLQCFPAPRRRA